MNFLPHSISRALIPGKRSSITALVDVSCLTADERSTLAIGLHPGFATKSRNPEPQHPVLIGVDNSLSMQESPIDELNRAIQEELVPTVQNDPLIARSVAIGLAGFSATGQRAIELLHPFAPPALFCPPVIRATTGAAHEVMPATVKLY